MKKSHTYRTKIIFMLCFAIITIKINASCVRRLKPACIITCLTAGSYMLYHDYCYISTLYKASKTERELETLLTSLTNNEKQVSPDPIWWITQRIEIERLKKTASEHKKKALFSYIFTQLYSRCERNQNHSNLNN